MVEVWADGYREEDGRHVFSVLGYVPVGEQSGLRVSGRTTTNAERVMVVLATIPSDEVANVRSL
jgi:hypothetical protein